MRRPVRGDRTELDGPRVPRGPRRAPTRRSCGCSSPHWSAWSAGRRGRQRGERGAGTVLVLAMVGVLVVVTCLAGAVVAAVATHRTAQTAADLAALAGAGALQLGGPPCLRAAAVARSNRAVLRRCSTDGAQVTVEVVADTVHLPGGVLDLPARARAGPVAGPP